MGLFDDILKKPVNQTPPSDPLSGMSGASGMGSSGQGGSQPPHDDSTPIVIEKTSPETVFGPESEETTMINMNPPATDPTVHAEADTSSILMNTPSEAPTINVAPVQVQNPGVTPNISLPEEQTITQMVPTPMITINTAPAASAPVEAMPIHLPEENITPVAPTVTAPTTQVVQSTVSNTSIFDTIMANQPTQPTSSDVTPPVTPSPISLPVSETSTPLYTTPSPMTTISQDTNPAVSTNGFSTPREFIEKSIANIDVMLTNIDARHSAKEVEEESYRIEKLKFTELEKNAHTEKIIMDKEREHTIHMRKILEAELERDAANKLAESSKSTHVESTLSEIGTEHAIHRHAHKKADTHNPVA